MILKRKLELIVFFHLQKIIQINNLFFKGFFSFIFLVFIISNNFNHSLNHILTIIDIIVKKIYLIIFLLFNGFIMILNFCIICLLLLLKNIFLIFDQVFKILKKLTLKEILTNFNYEFLLNKNCTKFISSLQS